ncbi:MAG TPA: hypothetical protein VFF73_38020 [Planctomycetota bacterium]|nr:hypothetical protein [Planctomycetota bacterium]
MALRGVFGRLWLALSGGGARSGPPLGAVVRSQYGPGTLGYWSGMDVRWLGERSPANVQPWQRKLMRKDSQVSLGLAALKSPFFGIDYFLKGGSQQARAFLQKTLLEAPYWNSLLWSVLNSMDFGFVSHEYVWSIEDVELDSDDGVAAPATLPSRYVIKRLRDLDPDRCEILIDEWDQLVGVRVMNVTLPTERLLHVVHEGEFGNLRGASVLDRAFPHWYDNVVNVIHLNRYLEQKGNPPLIGTAPNEIRYDDRKPRDQQTGRHCLDVLSEALASLRGGGLCLLPDERDDKGTPRWSVTALDAKERVEQFLPVIRYNDAKILRALWVPERIATQDSSVGSFAMSDVHFDVFLLALEVKKERTVLGPLNEVAQALVRYNFGRSESCPRVMATGLSRSNNDTLKEAFLKILQVPQTLPDGRTYNAAQLMKINEILRILKIPQHRIDDVAAPPVPQPAPLAPDALVPPPNPPTKGEPEPTESDQDAI